MGLRTYIQLLARDGPICYTGTVHTIAASPHLSPQALGSLLESLLKSLLDSLIESLLESLASEGVEFSTGSFWPMANSEFVEALANGRL